MGVARKTSCKELTLEEQSRIWERYECRHSIIAISKHFKVPCYTISSLINRLKLQALLDFYSKPRPKGYKKLNNRQERALVRYAVANLRVPLNVLATLSKSGKKLGINIVRKVLKAHSKAKQVP
jgi:transposase